MYPLSFAEFMNVCGEKLLWEKVCKSTPNKPLLEIFHEKCLNYLKKFLIIGGMPAVVHSSSNGIPLGGKSASCYTQ